MIKLWICFAILSMIISALSTISLKMIDKSKYDNDIFNDKIITKFLPHLKIHSLESHKCSGNAG